MATTKIKPQAMDSTTRLKSKVIGFTRDMTAASGDVSYTGVGFTPTSLMAIGVIGSSYPFMVGMVDSSRADASIFQYANNTIYPTSDFIVLATAAGVDQKAVVKTYDADGFTLTWTKGGSPTGTATIYCLCFS